MRLHIASTIVAAALLLGVLLPSAEAEGLGSKRNATTKA